MMYKNFLSTTKRIVFWAVTVAVLLLMLFIIVVMVWSCTADTTTCRTLTEEQRLSLESGTALSLDAATVELYRYRLLGERELLLHVPHEAFLAKLPSSYTPCTEERWTQCTFRDGSTVYRATGEAYKGSTYPRVYVVLMTEDDEQYVYIHLTSNR